jgi:hypothetical protein
VIISTIGRQDAASSSSKNSTATREGVHVDIEYPGVNDQCGSRKTGALGHDLTIGLHEPGSILGTEQFHILGCRRSLFLSSQTAAVKATAILLSLLSVGFHSLRVRK